MLERIEAKKQKALEVTKNLEAELDKLNKEGDAAKVSEPADTLIQWVKK